MCAKHWQQRIVKNTSLNLIMKSVNCSAFNDKNNYLQWLHRMKKTFILCGAILYVTCHDASLLKSIYIHILLEPLVFI